MTDDLDELLRTAIDNLDEQKRVKAARAQLRREPAESVGRSELAQFIRHYDETRVWNTTASVALIRVQRCTCGAEHQWFDGWMKEQIHRLFPQTRRLLAGKAEPVFPARVERHILKLTHECSACVRADTEETK